MKYIEIKPLNMVNFCFYIYNLNLAEVLNGFRRVTLLGIWGRKTIRYIKIIIRFTKSTYLNFPDITHHSAHITCEASRW